jgi:protoporphyrinogen oxidase
MDLLRFKPLNLMDRLRLGMLILRARQLSDWMPLESQTAQQWLVDRCGKQVYSVVWEPLLRAKFGSFAPEVSAVWFWNKLLLRGGSRDNVGREMLGFIDGGFPAICRAVAERVKTLGGDVQKGIPVTGILVENGCVRGVRTYQGDINSKAVIATPALPIIADLLDRKVAQEYINRLRRIRYLANVCLELELTERLSDIYWLNINDPDVPFTGVIEHTNLIPLEDCANRHIVYLSKYLEQQSEIYSMSAEQLLEYAIPYIKKIFTRFERSRIAGYHKWMAPFAQPLIERHYSKLICPMETPVKGFYISTMAQVYPQDRGVNYAIKY